MPYKSLAFNLIGAAGSLKQIASKALSDSTIINDRIKFELEAAVKAAAKYMDEDYHRGNAGISAVTAWNKDFVSELREEAERLHISKEFLTAVEAYTKKGKGGPFSAAMPLEVLKSLQKV